MKCYADFRDRVHPDDIEVIRANQEAAAQRGETFRNEFRIIRPDGKVRWLLSMGGAVYDATTGKPSRILGNNVEITERKQAELALAERNTQLALAGKAGLVATFAYDVKTERVQISEGYAEIYGFPEGTTEIARSQWRALVLPDDLERLESLRNQAFADRQREYSLEYRIIRPDGGVRWIETRSFASYDGEGRPQRVVGVNIDVTECRRMEQVLTDRNRQHELAGKAALVGSFAIDIDTALEDFSAQRMQISPGFAAIYGLPEETADISVGDRRSLVHPDDLPQFVEHRQRFFTERRSEFHAEFRIVRPGGTIHWIETRSFIEYDQAGQAKRLVGVNIDITERKRSELALAERNAQLLLAGKDAGVGCYANNFKTGLIAVTEGYVAIHGLPEGTTQTTLSRWRTKVHPDDLAQYDKLRQQIFDARRRDYMFDYRIIRDGGIRWIESRGLVSYDKDGQPQHVIGINIDITERKQLEDHKTALISELDHRVKNVLATVSAVASRTLESSNSMAEFVAALDGRIRSMANTHELLSSRHWQGVALAELVRRELAPYATASNTCIDGPHVVLSVEAGQMLAMVFHELATYAAKFGAISIKSGRVSVRWQLGCNGGAESGLRIHWEESGGPPVAQPTRSGYGTSVVRELVPYELGGAVKLTHGPEGVCCYLHVPAQWLSASAR